MNIEIENKPFCIFGLKGSGKTELAKNIAGQFGERAIVYDPLAEYPEINFDIYRPQNRDDVKELETFVRVVMRGQVYRLLIIDEANRYCPTKPHPLPSAVADLNDWHRHYNLACGFVCRRPTQLNQDITELAEYLFLYNLPGKNDIQYLNDLADGLGDTVKELPAFHFVIVDKNRNYEVHRPIPLLQS